MMLTYAQQCPRVPLRPRIARFPFWDRGFSLLGRNPNAEQDPLDHAAPISPVCQGHAGAQWGGISTTRPTGGPEPERGGCGEGRHRQKPITRPAGGPEPRRGDCGEGHYPRQPTARGHVQQEGRGRGGRRNTVAAGAANTLQLAVEPR